MFINRILIALLFTAGAASGAGFGDIPANLTLSASKSVRRNAGNTAFEAFTPLDSAVTSIATTSPISGGTITSTGTISLNVGTDFAFTAPQTVTLNDASTNIAGTVLTISHDTSGTPANALGSEIDFKAEDSTSLDQTQGAISTGWSDVTHATRSAYMTFATVNSGAVSSVMRLFPGGGLNVGIPPTTDPGTGIINALTGFKINGAATTGRIIRSDGSKFGNSACTFSDTPSTAGKVMVSDGTNWITSTPTFPNASATSRKKIVSDGTNWVASTETWAVPGTSGNVLTSDGTNWTSAAPAAGGGTVTNTGGSLTSNSVMLGAGGNDSKVVAGIVTDGTSKLTLGVAGTSVGSVDFKNATSGTVTLSPVTGALGTVTLSLPAATDTLVGKATTDTLTNKTLTSPVETAPDLGTPTALVGTNITGTGASFTAGSATKLANVGTPLSTSDTTVSNQQTPTTGGVTLASQTLASGSMWWIHAFGDYTAANSATARALEMQPNWGGTNLTKVTVNIKANTAVTTSWSCDLYIVGTSTTAAWVSGNAAFSGASTVAGQMTTATSASNTSLSSGAQTLDFRVDTSASVVGDSIVVKGVIMVRIK